jgi:hypothetical protein
MSLGKIFEQIRSNNDLLYLALLSFEASIDTSKSKMGSRKYVLPELVYLLDEKSLINLISYFAGETITIPKASVLKDQLYGILAYYYHDVEEITDWASIIDKMDLPYSKELEQKLIHLKQATAKNLKEIRLLPFIPNNKES